MTENRNPKDLILQEAGQFTRQQQLLAEYILEHINDVPFLAVPILASEAKVSEATVVRFAQRLGFKGYSELKSAFVSHLKARGMEAKNEYSEDSAIGSVLAQEIANIQQCQALNEEARFLTVARTLGQAQTVFCFGIGASSLMAEYLAYLLTQIGIRSAFLSCRYSSVACSGYRQQRKCYA